MIENSQRNEDQIHTHLKLNFETQASDLKRLGLQLIEGFDLK